MAATPYKKGSFVDRAKEYALFQYLRLSDGTLQVKTQNESSEKWVLVVKLDLLGDYVLIRNFLEAIKACERFKDHKLAFCCNAAIEELSKYLDKDTVDEWIPLKLKPFLKDKKYRQTVWSKLQKREYTTALFPTQSRSFFYDDMIARNVNAIEKIGAQGNGYNQLPWQRTKGESYFTKLIPSKKEKDFEYLKNKEFFNLALQEDRAPALPRINSHQQPQEPTVLLSPGASAEFRRWSTDNFIALTHAILNAVPTATVLISGSPAEKELGEAIKRPFVEDNRVRNACGTMKLSALTEVLATCHLVVSNESGTVHLARAVGVSHIYCISNGNHYGRFNPYPVHNDGIEVSYFYPAEVQSILKGKHEHISRDDLYWGSRINIDSLEAEEVIAYFNEHTRSTFQTV